MFSRITINPAQMGGLPCIRELRIPVATVVDMVAAGMSDTEILTDFPDLEPEDIRESLRYAAAALYEQRLPVTKSYVAKIEDGGEWMEVPGLKPRG